MIEIECPHCDEGIELEDDVFGLFDCPHCDEEFAWEDDDNDEDVSNEYTTNPLKISGMKIGFGSLLFTPMIWPGLPVLFGMELEGWVITFFIAVGLFSAGISVLLTAGIMNLNENR
jgi:hypothetical protein